MILIITYMYVKVIKFRFPAAMMIREIVMEKELKIREGMFMMVINIFQYIGIGRECTKLELDYYIHCTIHNSIVYSFWITVNIKIITRFIFTSNSNYFIYFLLFFLYTLDLTAATFFLSTFFSR